MCQDCIEIYWPKVVFFSHEWVIGHLEEPPVILRFMQLVCKNFFPSWKTLRISEFANFVFDHLDELLDSCNRKLEFVNSIEKWVKEENAKWSNNSHDRGKKNIKTYIEEIEAMQYLVKNLIAYDKCKDLK